MKKVLTGILCAALCGMAVLGAAACGGDDLSRGTGTTFSVYAPDGAPALALANLLDGEQNAATQGKNFDFDVHIVNADTIQTYVTGEEPRADFCILPVNAAAKALGSGTVYQMLGTVTNGNLYFLKTGSKSLPDLTAENLSEALLGKTLGVIQYDKVPGLTLRVVLEEKNIAYRQVDSLDDPAADAVNIFPCSATQVVPATGCDYYLCPEPARTTKIAVTQGKLQAAGSLQELYGGGNGYPQAALVAKKSVIENKPEAVERVISYMEGSAAYLATAQASRLDSLLAEKRTPGMDAAFDVSQLNPTVIGNCSVRYTRAADCKQAVIEFLTKFKGVSDAATSIPEDGFFYVG